MAHGEQHNEGKQYNHSTTNTQQPRNQPTPPNVMHPIAPRSPEDARFDPTSPIYTSFDSS
jgi:hypothetical protein